MLGLKKFLFKGGAPASLPGDVQASLEAWRRSAAPSMEELHFHTRYVVVDIVSSGSNPDSDKLLGLAATSIWKGLSSPTIPSTWTFRRWMVRVLRSTGN